MFHSGSRVWLSSSRDPQVSTGQENGHHAEWAMPFLHCTWYLPAERMVQYLWLSAKAFSSASACQGNPASIFVTLDDSYKAISVIAYKIDLVFIACQHRQNNNSDCQGKKNWGGIYHHKIQTKRTALFYYAFIVITSQKDTDFYNCI